MDVKVCNYHDVLLRYSDCLLLRDREWLNDQVMAFYLEYLRQERFPKLKDGLLLLDPSTAFLLTSLPAESAPMLLQPVDASSKLMVVVPINNNSDATVAGGTHWSLLCYLCTSPARATAAAAACAASLDPHSAADSSTAGAVQSDAVAAVQAGTGGQSSEDSAPCCAGEGCEEAAAFVHVDSCRGSNDAAVQRYLPAVRRLVGDHQAPFMAAASPQQQNGYDCGVFALEAAERLAHLAAAATATPPAPQADDRATTAPGGRPGEALLRAVEAVMASMSQQAVTEKREAILELVRQRAEPSAQLP